jgi:hypothetical protein
VDFLLCRIVPDATPVGVVVSPAPTSDFTVAPTYGSCDGSDPMDPAPPDDSDDTTATPVLPTSALD